MGGIFYIVLLNQNLTQTIYKYFFKLTYLCCRMHCPLKRWIQQRYTVKRLMLSYVWEQGKSHRVKSILTFFCYWGMGILVNSTLYSLQITPACNLPLKCLRGGGKVVIMNLQVLLSFYFASWLNLFFSCLHISLFSQILTENSKRQESKSGHPWICGQGVVWDCFFHYPFLYK